jgi:hypothetical protein
MGKRKNQNHNMFNDLHSLFNTFCNFFFKLHLTFIFELLIFIVEIFYLNY